MDSGNQNGSSAGILCTLQLLSHDLSPKWEYFLGSVFLHNSSSNPHLFLPGHSISIQTASEHQWLLFYFSLSWCLGVFRRLLYYVPDYRQLPSPPFQGQNKKAIAILGHVLLNQQDRKNKAVEIHDVTGSSEITHITYCSDLLTWLLLAATESKKRSLYPTNHMPARGQEWACV